MDNSLSAGLRARVSLEKHGFSFTRTLGQNFILDDDFLEEIVRMSGVDSCDGVLEIGPGAGVLTSHLSKCCRQVLAVEIDQNLRPVLDEVLEGAPNVKIVYEDVMKCRLPALLSDHFPNETVKVVANLPYYITADAIERLLTCGADIGDITLMLQKEAAERVGAAIGGKNYCALTMLTKYYRNVEVLAEVPPERFTPKPHVMSRLIRLTRREGGVRAADEAFLLRVIRSAFHMRRKTLVNNLTGDFKISREQAEQVLENLNLDRRIRGEALTVDQIAQLSNALKNNLDLENGKP